MNQGVVISLGWVAECILALVQVCDPHALVFPMSAALMRRDWQRFWEKRGFPMIKALHDLRHSAAAADLESGRRDLPGVQKRGRWRFITSCHRYTKTHLVVMPRVMFGESIISQGRKFRDDPRSVIVDAIRRGPAATTPEGQAVMSRLLAGPRLEDNRESVRPGESSPRIPIHRDVSLAPDVILDEEIRARGRVPPGRRHNKERMLKKLQKDPLLLKRGDLDSECNTAGSWSSGEDDVMANDVPVGSRTQDRARATRRRLTARKNKDGMG